MNLKNLSAQNKNHKKILNHLNTKKVSEIFKEFSSSIKIKKKLAVAVSGGPDSLALAYLTKCYSIKNKISVKYFIVDHKIRKESSLEAKKVKEILKKFDIQCKVLKWNGKKPTKSTQAAARYKRYSLLSDECKKNDIKYLLLGHHINDLFENFFIRLLRGSGLKGLISLSKNTNYKDQNLNILRPLLDLEKNDLMYLSKKIFNFSVKDPSNINKDYKRTRIRNLLQSLKKEGLDKKKFKLTIDNLKKSDESIKFYVNKNLENNSFFSKKENIYILNLNFFDQSYEIIFRSLTKIIKDLGNKYYPARGKSIDDLIKKINKPYFPRMTLGGCFIDRVNKTILISRESTRKN
jgi:tRNA(Ile)-lysidine synthase